MKVIRTFQIIITILAIIISDPMCFFFKKKTKPTAPKYPNGQTKESMIGKKLATFGGGCFWCTEACLKTVKGVTQVTSGYCNGHVKNPTYKQVCSGNTGHNEVIQITFDPDQVSYLTLLKAFFKAHDPTTLNRQGNDAGTQYRSGIYYHDAEQKATAESLVSQLNSEIFNGKIVTEIEALDVFYPAEDYHQDYFAKNPNQGYCQGVVSYKLRKFLNDFQQ